MRILTFSTLYPNGAQPNHGVFVENRLRRLVASGGASARVVAPVPWFPSTAPQFGRWAAYAAAPRREIRHGLEVAHPRYPVIPKVGMSVAPFALYWWSRAAARRAIEDSGAQLIDAHYFYPDGVAAALLAREFGLPFVVTARGTDLNVIPQHAVPRRLIRWAAARASGLIAVSPALKQKLADLGIPDERILVLRNGVDLEQFRVCPRAPARARLAFERPTLLSVGNLVENKGFRLVLAALQELPEFAFALVGEGPERPTLEAAARTMGLAGRVRFLGAVPHAELPEIYAAADALILASSREGWPNVLLEALACGTPVISTRVGAAPEIVADPAAGVLADDRTPGALARAVRRLFAEPPDRQATRAYAERFSWDATTEGQRALFARILAAPSRRIAA